MITNKIFVFFPYPCDINMGGPAGFIAHNLLDKPRDFFCLPQDFMEVKEDFYDKIKFSVRLQIEKLRKNKDIYMKEHFNKHQFEVCNATKYKYIYFHDCETMYSCRNILSKDQFVILQSHSPELPSQEYFNSKSNIRLKEKIMFNYIKKAEKYAFNRANLLIFPNKFCIDLYKDVLPDNPNIDFILSGAKSTYNETSLQNNILDKEKINLLYIGRRNHVKGFDIILAAFRNAYKIKNNINLIIIGNGQKIEEDGIIDIGFSKSPISWYNQVDYVINANRQSYFDLSIIEALSTGVPLIISENYGHKWFKNKSEQIITYNGTVEALSDILCSTSLTKRNKQNSGNIELYNKYLTDELYYKRFVCFFESLQKSTLKNGI